MKFGTLTAADSLEVVALFETVFTRSEGAREGALIGALARDLMSSLDAEDIHGFLALHEGEIVGAIFFTRLAFDHPREAFLLAPVAVHGDHQGVGIGQTLIAHGLREMARRGVSFVATYGDPAFYSRVGFRPLSQDVIRPPYELSQPEGWLGQMLTSEPLASVTGRCSCVRAFDDRAYW